MGVGMQLLLGVKHEYHYCARQNGHLFLLHVSLKIWKTIDVTGR